MTPRAIYINVKGKPIAKQSTKIDTQHGKIHGFTPEHIKNWQKTVADHARVEAYKQDWEMLEGPVRIILIYRVPDKRRRDLTNLSKCVEDALSGIIYKDDNQIIDEHHRKVVCPENPGVEILVYPTTEEEVKGDITKERA